MSCLTCAKRKVTFNNTVKVVYYKQTLIEPDVCWQQIARDRIRFRRRTLDIEQKIGWVFTPQHRKYVYKMLYS